jgi:hypothetical protein
MGDSRRLDATPELAEHGASQKETCRRRYLIDTIVPSWATPVAAKRRTFYLLLSLG